MAKKSKKDLEAEKNMLALLSIVEQKLETMRASIEKITEDIRGLRKQFPSKDLFIVMNTKDIYDPYLENALARLNAGCK